MRLRLGRQGPTEARCYAWRFRRRQRKPRKAAREKRSTGKDRPGDALRGLFLFPTSEKGHAHKCEGQEQASATEFFEEIRADTEVVKF